MEGTGMTVNNRPVLRPVVDYTLSSGSTITLLGDPRHDYKSSDEDGLVDLRISDHKATQGARINRKRKAQKK